MKRWERLRIFASLSVLCSILPIFFVFNSRHIICKTETISTWIAQCLPSTREWDLQQKMLPTNPSSWNKYIFKFKKNLKKAKPTAKSLISVQRSCPQENTTPFTVKNDHMYIILCIRPKKADFLFEVSNTILDYQCYRSYIRKTVKSSQLFFTLLQIHQKSTFCISFLLWERY